MVLVCFTSQTRNNVGYLTMGLYKHELRVCYTPPYDWDAVLASFRAHQLPDLETVDECSYERVIQTPQGLGWFRVFHDAKECSLRVWAWNVPEEDLPFLIQAVRRMFDGDADPSLIQAAMNNDLVLSVVWAQYPGLRVARWWNAFEAIQTTILGQLVSVPFGRILTHELMKAAGQPARHPKTNAPIYLFPTPEDLKNKDLSTVRTSERRREAIRCVGMLFADEMINENKGDGRDLRRILRSVPGVGIWSSEYIAMRGFGDKDAFPATDYALKQELQRYADMDVNRVRPYRAYAAVALWRQFVQRKAMTHEFSV
jgi:DNA-3-methyladenine glycosylase II